MKGMRLKLGGWIIAWYVVTYSGQAVAGPFTLLGECTDMAKYLASRYYNVSTVCVSR
jgi:hypothetical protein